uniref:Immunoglobulin V-set domain-containing protein n=1 Tax=Paramormyrops kingsleyae TaxID=1676925 RepID=A0A3B3T5I3_9TELE
MTTLLKCAVFIVVLLTPGLCKYIIVCQEEDEDIRVDCNIESKANQLPTYTFIMSSGKKEHIINTNSTTEKVADNFKDKSTVEQLPTGGFRLTMSGYQPTENTTFTCRSNTGTNPDHMVVEKGKMLPCSTISVYLHSSSWLFYLLLTFYSIQSWQLLVTSRKWQED